MGNNASQTMTHEIGTHLTTVARQVSTASLKVHHNERSRKHDQRCSSRGTAVLVGSRLLAEVEFTGLRFPRPGRERERSPQRIQRGPMAAHPRFRRPSRGTQGLQFPRHRLRRSEVHGRLRRFRFPFRALVVLVVLDGGRQRHLSRLEFRQHPLRAGLHDVVVGLFGLQVVGVGAGSFFQLSRRRPPRCGLLYAGRAHTDREHGLIRGHAALLADDTAIACVTPNR